jgi:hypothetical protein
MAAGAGILESARNFPMRMIAPRWLGKDIVSESNAFLRDRIVQPAGDYLLDTDEELIEYLSRLAYRRGIFGSIRLGETGKKLEVD